MTSLVLEALPGVGIVMPLVWQKRLCQKRFCCLQVMSSPPKRKIKLLEKKKDKNAPKGTSKPVTEKEAYEFLKFIKHSKYSVIEQLNKMPVRISLQSLFQSSKTHHNALLKVLDEAYVTPTISVDEIDQLIGNITTSACIAFTDEEIPPRRSGQH